MFKKIYLTFISIFLAFVLTSCNDSRDFNLDKSAIDYGVFAKEYLNSLLYESTSYKSSDNADDTHIEVFLPQDHASSVFFRTVDISSFAKDDRKKSIHFGPLFYHHPFFNNALAYSDKVLNNSDLLNTLSSEISNFNREIFTKTIFDVTDVKNTNLTLQIYYFPVKYDGYEATKDGTFKVVTSYLLVPYHYALSDLAYDDSSFTSNSLFKTLTFDESNTYLEKKYPEE